MDLTFGVYNVEWMRDLFDLDGIPRMTHQEKERSQQLAEVIQTIDPDFLGIVEGPNTLVDQSKTASQQLVTWTQQFIPDSNYQAIHGFPSPGQQELCAIYKPDKVKVLFTPENDEKKSFKEPFLVDTTNRLIHEQYKHYRPPLELSILDLNDQLISRVIVAHTKSKGIFDRVDYARFEQLSARDRLRLFAECTHIRSRCDDYLEKGQPVIVMGDINDGFELDFYENKFSKSAVEILLGDPWKPEWILKSVLPKPKLNSYGWVPNSGRFRDRITGDEFNVLIDHILGSQTLNFSNGKVWNPYTEKNDPEIQAISNSLKKGSDHFPISVTLSIYSTQNSMDAAAQTMIANLEKNTGKSLDEWVSIVKKENFQKHGEILKFLKADHGFTHGFANLVAHKTLKSDAGSVSDTDELITKQYKGKEHFLPLFEKLKKEISAFGKDVEFAPKNAYVSVRRKKQFALLIPATKTRYEVGVNLKGEEPSGILEIDTKSNGMVSHRIMIVNPEEQYWRETIDWLKKAYDAAG